MLQQEIELKDKKNDKGERAWQKVKVHGIVPVVEMKVQNGWESVPLAESGTLW